jgi:HD-GYP domain-containing protein (c-di-GMP phosphodiesterase class II)
MDGTGSPDGLAGCAIPLPARIIAVADAYVDLAASSLCGVGPILPDVRSKLLRLRGSTLDPDLVGLFLKRCSGPLK